MATVEELKKMSILDVAQALGMEMKRQSGNTYYWTEHDSFKINTNRNIWHWFSQDKGGNVFSLVQEIKGVSFKEAKHFLETGEFPKVVIDEKPPEPFRYILEPYEHPNFDLGREYLRKERGLSEETIDAFLNQGNLAEATRKKGDYFEPVIVFKSKNVDGKIVGASLQGIVENWVQYPERGRLKQVMTRSDGMSGFSFDIGTPNRLIFLEAPIDLMSYYELHKDSLENVRLVAMDGVKKSVISRYTADLLTDGRFSQERSQKDILNALDNILKTTSTFEDNPNLITLAVDNDEAGLKFIEKLKEDNIPFQIDLAPKSDGVKKMDWNEYLQKEKAGEKTMAEENNYKEFQIPFFNTEILDRYVEEVMQHYTDDISTAEYLFPDGRMVSSWEYDARGDDHRAIRNYFDVMGRPELDILNDHPKDFWNLVHNGLGAVRLVPETQTALLLEGQSLTTIQKEILQSSSLKIEVYQEGQTITSTYLKRLGVLSVEEMDATMQQPTVSLEELYQSEFLAGKPDVMEYLQEENASSEEVQSVISYLKTLDTERWEWITPVQYYLDELRQEQHLKQLEKEKLEYGEELFSIYHSPEFNTKPFVVDWLKEQNATASEVQHVLDFIPTVYQEDWYNPDVWKSELDAELSSFRDKAKQVPDVKLDSTEQEKETNLSMEQQKALDRSQEPSNTGGELFNRNFSSLETEVSGIALQPEESKTQPDFPANVHLHFNIDRTTKSRFKLRSGYHYPEEKDVRILNSYSDSLQSSAQHYLNDFADQKIIYAFSEEEQVRFLEVDFEKRHWMHLTGIMPVYDEHLPSVAEKFIDEIASGHTTFKNVTLGQGFNDKIKVLPMLSELLEAKAFTFNDLSTVQKFQRLELEKGIKPENKDLILALKTDDQSTFPASLMKLSQKIYKTIEPDQKVVLGVFAKKDNEIRTLSVNRDYITDGGKEMLTTLQENRAIDQMKAEEKKQRQAQKIEIVQDSDADGLSDEVEYGQGTDPFGPNVKDTQIENISQPEMDTRSVSEMIAANDTRALAQHMKEGVKQYFDSDQYKTFLTAMSHFNNYSPRNIQLLLAQNPKISKVASANCWSEEFGRYINKGAKALRVWAPSTVTQKDPKTGQSMLDKNGNEIKVTRFRLVPVFDVSQTNGKELPKAIYELEGTHEDYANLYRAAKTVSLDKGVSFKIDSNWSQKGNGYYSPKANEIVIKGGMSEQQTLKTIFHEMAHSDLHNPENISENAMKRSTAELQAESVAYVVANHYGLDTSEYSFAYLAGWSRDPKALSDLEEQLSIVQNEAKSLISRLDTVLEKQVTKTVAQSKFMEQMNHFKKQSQEKLAAKQKEREQEEPPKKSQARQELNEP